MADPAEDGGLSTASMGRLEFASPRAAWGGEAVAFTPLLAQEDLLAYLGEETAIGHLTPVEVEHRIGTRYADILSETADGRRVVIENQYGSTDHDHLTRGLAYAVALEAAALVIVAEDHGDEFVSVANYLNDVAGQAESGIRVWLVKVRAVRRLGDSVWSPEFVVQAGPNVWEAAVRRDAPPVLGTLDDFYELCRLNAGDEWAVTARAIIEEWLDRPGAREFHGNQQTVSLFYPAPRNPSGVNVIQLSTSGGLYIVRGYIWLSSGVFDPNQDPTELDDRIRAAFPGGSWGERGHSIKVTGGDLEHLRGFLDWLVNRYDAALESRDAPL